MLVISSREFRENQKKYLDSVDSGEQIIVRRGKNRAYKLVPVSNDDTCMTVEEFKAKIDHSLQQAREGKVTRINNVEEFKELLGI